MSRLTLFLIPFLAASVGAANELKSSRIYTEQAGIHRVTWEDLNSAGAIAGAVESDLISLRSHDRLERLRVSDGGDGTFDPGDHVEFVAALLHGRTTYLHPHSPLNVYWLESNRDKARRFGESTPIRDEADTPPASPRRRQHFEKDQLLIRLSSRDLEGAQDPELWYWKKMTHRSKERFLIDVDIRGAIPDQPWLISAGMRGLSTATDSVQDAPRSLRDHQVEVRLDGESFLKTAWDGKGPHTVERNRAKVPLRAEQESLVARVRVLPQTHEEEKLIDVVMFDWLETDFQIEPVLHHEHVEWRLPAEDTGKVLAIASTSPGTLSVFVDRYWEWESDGSPSAIRVGRKGSIWLRRDDFALRPFAIDVDRPSDLRSYSNQADHLILAHGSLTESSERLADLHRERGLTARVIDVQDVYDEFGGGIVSPEAIREFLRFAFHNWSQPRPRFVLLVGDASWDTKNSTVDEANYANWGSRDSWRGDRFGTMEVAHYTESLLNNRNLIPSWNYHAAEGHAASDAYFVMVDGDDDLPDLALGRLPVVEPAEVDGIVGKIERYLKQAPLGPWRARHLWITGGISSHKSRSRKLADRFSGEGFPPSMVLPGDEASETDRDRIMSALDRGTLVTHFIGHGGRFIWRTAPPDLSDQIDLFGLEELERLAPTDRLGVVVSVACYSAPFDHPSSDSIGEAFLRLPDRGAIGFIGASWRNAPPQALSEGLVEALSRSGTVGEALLDVKRALGRSDPTHLYNLLGDPAVPIAAPQAVVGIQPQQRSDGVSLSAELPEEAVGGNVSWALFDDDGAHIGDFESPVEATTVQHTVPLDTGATRATLYFWNETTGVDGHGGALLPSPDADNTDDVAAAGR